jgi:hypothetical protein
MRRVLITLAAGLLVTGVSVAGAQTRLQPSGEQPTSPGSAAPNCGTPEGSAAVHNGQPCNRSTAAPNAVRRPNGTRE